MSAPDRRAQRQEIRLLQREATWLQKALFALGKAAEARDRMVPDEEGDSPYLVELEEGSVPLDAVEDALAERVKEILEHVRERRRVLR